MSELVAKKIDVSNVVIRSPLNSPVGLCPTGKGLKNLDLWARSRARSRQMGLFTLMYNIGQGWNNPCKQRELAEWEQ
jgi:hypothetical protein